MTTSIVWHSSFAALTGYTGSSRAFVFGLDERGVAVRPLFLYGADHDEQVIAGHMHPHIRELQTLPLRLDVPQVVYAPADRFSKNSGSYRIGFTMLEVDRLPPDWVQQANQMDEVWTPTAWGADTMRASGVTRPIHVVPLGVDTALFRPASTPRTQLTNRTVFLSVFEWGVRKGWDILLRAYRAAFKPDDPVLLLLKVDCRAPAPNPVREMTKLLSNPSPPVALLYNQPLTTAQLVELYSSADCFVLPTHGEGWGMPILESMACGVPAISTDWSGATAFLTGDNGYLLPTIGLVAANQEHPYYRNARWANPDEAALVELLRHVAANPDERRSKGAQAVQAAQAWTWARGVDAIHHRLMAL
jgi:glycosyltransferase involved in cell wall biosynthesis